MDVANPLDTSKGMPPTLTVCNDDSLGEQIQRAFPEVRVVKTLNTVTAAVMVQPDLVPGSHTMFICGDDEAAKEQVGAPARRARLAGAARSSISATSPPPAGWRCTSRCGCACGARTGRPS